MEPFSLFPFLTHAYPWTFSPQRAALGPNDDTQILLKLSMYVIHTRLSIQSWARSGKFLLSVNNGNFCCLCGVRILPPLFCSRACIGDASITLSSGSW